ncbi:MAG: hypothetical protein CMJ83_21875 [Planctomycetes bacterium]|nr:hypothetical protein [Planctomycetota bacterium]
MRISLTVLACFVALVFSSTARGQMMQTLPAGNLSGAGGGGSAYPFNATADHTWQWHYDSGQFTFPAPIIITEVYVRGLNSVPLGAYDFPSVEIVMASSPTDYTVLGNGVQPGHDPIFANNLNTDQTTVRPAAPWVGNQAAAGWEPLGMVTPFLYDPTVGDDFVIQIRKCGTNIQWGTSIFGTVCCPANVGINGGNRYGSTSSCSATSSTFQNNEFVPIVRIDFSTGGSVPCTLQVAGNAGSGGGFLSYTSVLPGIVEGATLISLDTIGPVGGGPFIGIYPDAFTDLFIAFALSSPAGPGNPLHWSNTPGLFPNAPFQILPGTFPPNTVVDFVGVKLDVAGQLSATNVVRGIF